MQTALKIGDLRVQFWRPIICFGEVVQSRDCGRAKNGPIDCSQNGLIEARRAEPTGVGTKIDCSQNGLPEARRAEPPGVGTSMDCSQIVLPL